MLKEHDKRSNFIDERNMSRMQKHTGHIIKTL